MKKEVIVAIDIGASKVRIQLVNSLGVLGPETLFSLIGKDINNSTLLELITENTKKIISASDDSMILAICVGSPGPLDSSEGIIRATPNLPEIKNFNIVDELKNNFPDIEVYLLNDADAAGLGEWWFGSGKGCKNFVYITLGTGVGSSFLLDGELVRGLGMAPEWGHTSLSISNTRRQCGCSQWNCAEAYLGTTGLSMTYAEILGINIEDMSLEEKYSVSFKIKEGVKNNDPLFLKVADEYSKNLAVFIRNIILVHQPEVITLGGGIIYENEKLLALTNLKLKELMDIKKDHMGIMLANVRLCTAKFENAVNLGAAKYALKKLKLLQL